MILHLLMRVTFLPLNTHLFGVAFVGQLTVCILPRSMFKNRASSEVPKESKSSDGVLSRLVTALAMTTYKRVIQNLSLVNFGCQLSQR